MESKTLTQYEEELAAYLEAEDQVATLELVNPELRAKLLDQIRVMSAQLRLKDNAQRLRFIAQVVMDIVDAKEKEKVRALKEQVAIMKEQYQRDSLLWKERDDVRVKEYEEARMALERQAEEMRIELERLRHIEREVDQVVVAEERALEGEQGVIADLAAEDEDARQMRLARRRVRDAERREEARFRREIEQQEAEWMAEERELHELERLARKQERALKRQAKEKEVRTEDL